MNIVRAYPHPPSLPRLLARALRRLVLGTEAVQAPPEPGLDLHVAPLAGEARLLVAGQPTGSWRRAVLEARAVTSSFSAAIDHAVVTLYQRAPSSLEVTAPHKALPRGARPGGPRYTPATGDTRVAIYGKRPDKWVDTPAGLWSPRPGLVTRRLDPPDDMMDVPTDKLVAISARDHAAILARLNHRPLDRSYQH